MTLQWVVAKEAPPSRSVPGIAFTRACVSETHVNYKILRGRNWLPIASSKLGCVQSGSSSPLLDGRLKRLSRLFSRHRPTERPIHSHTVCCCELNSQLRTVSATPRSESLIDQSPPSIRSRAFPSVSSFPGSLPFVLQLCDVP